MLPSTVQEFRRYKALAEGAIAQVGDPDLLRGEGGASNSIAVLMAHLSGNLRSRFTDFLTSDGEKPWRDRDHEFAAANPSREQLWATWEQGWDVLFSTLESLSEGDLRGSVTIRGVSLTVVEALQRSLAHLAYHVGQIVLLARGFAGEAWTPLSIPPGQSNQYNENPTLEKGPASRGLTNPSRPGAES